MPLRDLYNRALAAKSRVKGRYDAIVSFYRPNWQKILEEEDFIEPICSKLLKKDKCTFC